MCPDVRHGVRGHEVKYKEQLEAVEEIVRLVEFGIFVIVSFCCTSYLANAQHMQSICMFWKKKAGDIAEY